MPLALWAVLKLPIGTADTHQWLPDGRVERQRYEEFLRNFGSDQVLLVSWEGATLQDPRVAQFIELALTAASSSELVTKIISPLEIVESLERPPLNLKRADAVNRLSRTFIGSNGTLAIVVCVSQQGAIEHDKTIELVRTLADSVPKLGRQQLRLVGSVFESFAIDKAAGDSLSKLVLPSTILALFISWLCVGSLRAVCVVMLLAGSGQLFAVSVVYYGGFEFSAVMIVLPTLVFMLTLSGAVHLVNYLLEARLHDSKASGVEAIKKGWWPCLLSSATTMLGMGSLLTSELMPVRQFGVLSALCLGIATLVMLLAFPATADLLFGQVGPAQRLARWLGFSSKIAEAGKPKFLSIPPQVGLLVLTYQKQLATWIAVAGLVLLAIVSVGLLRLKSSNKFCDMFPAENKARQDLVWFEDNIGPIAAVEVLLRFEKGETANLLDQAKQVVHLVQHLKDSEPIGGLYSAANFFPTLTEATGIRATTIRAAQKRNLEVNLHQLEAKGLFYQTAQETIWRVSARVPAVSSLGYGELTAKVADQVEQLLENEPLECQFELTGLYPVLHETQMTLLSDLGFSFLSAYLLITPVMMIVVRSILGGILIMIPNILPIAIAFGVMGWIGWPLDIAGVLTASVALGIAVDDTLHFVCWYMNELKMGCSRPIAVARAFQACSSAMMHTTLISGCSMFPFLFADFVPTQQFATLMISILVAALIADLILLPALLISPAGKWIRASQD